jgi:hypothetical protein
MYEKILALLHPPLPFFDGLTCSSLFESLVFVQRWNGEQERGRSRLTTLFLPTSGDDRSHAP